MTSTIIESPKELDRKKLLMSDFEGTLGFFDADYMNGWQRIHDRFSVPDWPLYEKYMDENGDLYHGSHAAEDTLLIRRVTDDRLLNLGREMEKSEIEVSEDWFSDRAITEARAEYRPCESTDEEYFKEVAEELAGDWDFYPGALDMLETSEELGYQPVILSALPVSVTSEVLASQDIQIPVYEWKKLSFDDKGSFQAVEVSHEDGKQEIVSDAMDSGNVVTYVGDGSNDILAISRANGGGIYLGDPEEVPNHSVDTRQLEIEGNPDAETFSDISEILQGNMLRLSEREEINED